MTTEQATDEEIAQLRSQIGCGERHGFTVEFTDNSGIAAILNRLDAEIAARKDAQALFERSFANGAAMTKERDVAVRENDALRAALEVAINLIQQWHSLPDAGLPENLRNRAWEIYYMKSPEMEPIRRALHPEQRETPC
jgi:hypothetical protein